MTSTPVDPVTQYTAEYWRAIEKQFSAEELPPLLKWQDIPLTSAVVKQDYVLVRQLLDYGADVDVWDTDWNTPLHHAVALPDLRIMELLLERKAPVNAHNRANLTPLYRALFKYPQKTAKGVIPNAQMISIVTLLLKYGADPDLYCGEGHSGISGSPREYWGFLFEWIEKQQKRDADSEAPKAAKDALH